MTYHNRRSINNSSVRIISMTQEDLAEKASRDEKAERELLNKVKENMTQEDLAELTRATPELRLKQETPDPPEALNTVPTLSLQDIPKKPVHVPTEVGNINGVKVLQHDLFTLDVLYAEVVFNMETLKQDLLPLLPLFWRNGSSSLYLLPCLPIALVDREEVLMRYLLGVTDKEREIRRDDILSTRLKDFKEFVDFLEIVKDKGVVVAVASPDDVPATNKERSDFFEVKSIIGC